MLAFVSLWRLTLGWRARLQNTLSRVTVCVCTVFAFNKNTKVINEICQKRVCRRDMMRTNRVCGECEYGGREVLFFFCLSVGCERWELAHMLAELCVCATRSYIVFVQRTAH